MAENEANKSLSQVPTQTLGIKSPKNNNNKSTEYISVCYNIEKISGLRSGKRSNSFRAPSGTNIKTMIQTVLKKIRFSTRYKYAILYFDQTRHSNI